MSHSYRVLNSQGHTEFDGGARPSMDMALEPGQRLSIRCRLQVDHDCAFIEMTHGNATAVTEPVYSPPNVLFIDIVGDNAREVLELERRMLEWAGLTIVPYDFQQRLLELPQNISSTWKRIKWLMRWLFTGNQ